MIFEMECMPQEVTRREGEDIREEEETRYGKAQNN
jgi:hypothetical protein